TEYLLQLRLYLRQARELAAFAGPEAVIRVSRCDEAPPLLALLGYQLRQGCGPEAAVQVADTSRAFLTINSGFPLAELEEALRQAKPFTVPYSSSRVPVMFALNDWGEFTEGAKNKADKADLVDILLHSKAVARLYAALGAMDAESAVALRKSVGLPKLIRYANILDFYGSHLSIRSGKVLVPGGPPAEAAWTNLVGADPRSPGEFVNQLMTQDAGWLAAYFAALSYGSPQQQAYLTEGGRLKRNYAALRGSDLLPGPARGVMRSAPELWLLVTRLRVESDQLAVPGNLQVWKQVFMRNRVTRRDREWARRAENWSDPQQLLEGLFALSRQMRRDAPLQAYLSLTEIDRRRAPQQRLTPEA